MKQNVEQKIHHRNLHKFKVAYEVIVIILALISVLFIIDESSKFKNLDFWIWIVFVSDFIIRFSFNKNKIEFLKKNPLDLIAIIPLDSIFRLARIVRLMRLLRSVVLFRQYINPVYCVLRTNHLDKVILAVVILIFISSIPIQLIEPSINSYSDAVWWAIVTSTTVGYGDISPTTIPGRLIATVLMIFGIGLIGMVTSSVASYFLKSNQVIINQDATINFIKGQLDHINELSDEEIERLNSLISSYKKAEKQNIV